MERDDRQAIATFYAPGEWTEHVMLDADAAHHAHVRRLAAGDMMRLTNGAGRRARAAIAELGKRDLRLTIDAESVEHIAEPPRIELWAPVGDRERMLMLAEKSVELGVSAWRPVLYARSRSVSPRGEGEGFRQKVRARQIAALEQSGGAWLPSSSEEVALDVALAAESGFVGTSLLLDAAGEHISDVIAAAGAPARIALGPEGGLTEEERKQFSQAGWRPVSLAANVLRFETAGIAALAILRAHIR